MQAVLKTAIRLTLKPVLSPRVPIGVQRVWGGLVGRSLLGAKGVQAQRDPSLALPTWRYRQATSTPRGTLLYLHGGAYVIGGPESHGTLCQHLAVQTGAEIWLPEYRLAPEHRYPAARDDALTTYRAILDAGVDPRQITLAGDSAGGGLALATVLAIRDQGWPMPAGLVLLSPWVDLTQSGATHATHARRDPMIRTDWGHYCAAAYCGETPLTDPGCSPLFANLEGLPPVLIQCGSEEVLLDDARRLDATLGQAGVPCTLRVYEGMWHDFQLHARLLKDADVALAEIGGFVRRVTAG